MSKLSTPLLAGMALLALMPLAANAPIAANEAGAIGNRDVSRDPAPAIGAYASEVAEDEVNGQQEHPRKQR
jgi:hypothetical protein